MALTFIERNYFYFHCLHSYAVILRLVIHQTWKVSISTYKFKVFMSLAYIPALPRIDATLSPQSPSVLPGMDCVYPHEYIYNKNNFLNDYLGVSGEIDFSYSLVSIVIND